MKSSPNSSFRNSKKMADTCVSKKSLRSGSVENLDYELRGGIKPNLDQLIRLRTEQRKFQSFSDE